MGENVRYSIVIFIDIDIDTNSCFGRNVLS